jgi:hypothetical protein
MQSFQLCIALRAADRYAEGEEDVSYKRLTYLVLGSWGLLS